jgi:hypothetical protein
LFFNPVYNCGAWVAQHFDEQQRMRLFSFASIVPPVIPIAIGTGVIQIQSFQDFSN